MTTVLARPSGVDPFVNGAELHPLDLQPTDSQSTDGTVRYPVICPDSFRNTVQRHKSIRDLIDLFVVHVLL